MSPGETRTFSFVARSPGVFLYHCGTSPVLMHIGMGMYGAILVEPARAARRHGRGSSSRASSMGLSSAE